MELPQIRPGKVGRERPSARLIAFFPNAAEGNAVIQLLPQIGIPSDGLGVSPPEWIEGGQGMVLAIDLPDPDRAAEVEALCRSRGATVRHLRD